MFTKSMKLICKTQDRGVFKVICIPITSPGPAPGTEGREGTEDHTQDRLRMAHHCSPAPPISPW